MAIKRILHASDFSKASQPALKLALEMAKACGAELILFHAYQWPMAPVMGEAALPPKVLEEMFRAGRAQARRKLEGLARVARRGRVRVSILLGEGPPATAIVRAAKGRRAGLIVLGTHGRTGVARMLIGSVAERVVRTARCPVLIVGGGRS